MLIYLGVFFILPDKIKKNILSNGLLCATIIAGFLAGLYGISTYSTSEGFYQSNVPVSGGCANSGKPCDEITCSFTATISVSGALSQVSVVSGNLIKDMKITADSSSSLSLPENTILSSYNTSTVSGQLNSSSTFVGGSGSFIGTYPSYCLVNQKSLPTSDADQSVSFNIYGRYVRIYASATEGDGKFALSQVLVNNAAGTNIALGKTATATSTDPSSKPASTALDGTTTLRVKSSIWNNKNIGRDTEYWEVDLGSAQMITTVRVITDIPLNTGNSQSVNLGTGYVKNNGLRIVVIKEPTEVRTPEGICVAQPTPIYPAGTTDDEKRIIGSMILDGLNGQTALNVYRGVEKLPVTFTIFGLTDSQSAAAVLKIKSANLMQERKAGKINDDTYFSSINALKKLTTMAGINDISLDPANELRIYMAANKKITKVVGSPVISSSGKDGSATIITTDDGGKEKATKIVMGILKSKTDDPSAAYSQLTDADEDNTISAPPDTGTWSQTLLQNMPQNRVAITLPSSGPTSGSMSGSMTAEQRVSAVRVSNPTALILTPEMSAGPGVTSEQAAANKAAAIAAANNARNGSSNTNGTSPLSISQMDAAAGATSSSRGFVSPKLSKTQGGQSQVYMITTPVASSQAASQAASQCVSYNGRLATLQQIKDAQKNGAAVSDTIGAGWYSDTFNAVAYPTSIGVKSATPGTGSYPVNCYGPKPPPGTPNIAPWTNVAASIPTGPKDTGGQTYKANDWSQRAWGDGGFAKDADGILKYPGAPFRTQEVYYVGGTQSITKEQSTTICKTLGGNLATEAQLNTAKGQDAKWCGAGFVSDKDTVISLNISDCPAATVNGALCFGIKPSKDTGVDTATITSGDSGVNFDLSIEPFNKNKNSSSWTQVAVDPALYCRTGTVARDCMIDDVMTPTCVKQSNPICSNTCSSTTASSSNTVGGKKICSTVSPPQPSCPAGSMPIICDNSFKCTPMGGDCSTAYAPTLRRQSPAPTDLSESRYQGYCNYLMNKSNMLAMTGNKVIFTRNRAVWPPPPQVAAVPAIHYVTDDKLAAIKTSKQLNSAYTLPGIDNLLGKEPTYDMEFCIDNPTFCKYACCWGGTPKMADVYFTRMNGTYPGNADFATHWKPKSYIDGYLKPIQYLLNHTDTVIAGYDRTWEDVRAYGAYIGNREVAGRGEASGYHGPCPIDKIMVCPSALGVVCGENGDCLSNSCKEGKCACLLDSDCYETNTCNKATGKCKKMLDDTCSDDGECVSGKCLADINRYPKMGTTGVCGCKVPSDCVNGDCTNNICRKKGGEPCGNVFTAYNMRLKDQDCISGKCMGAPGPWDTIFNPFLNLNYAHDLDYYKTTPEAQNGYCGSRAGENCGTRLLETDSYKGNAGYPPAQRQMRDADCIKSGGFEMAWMQRRWCENEKCLAGPGEECLTDINCATEGRQKCKDGKCIKNLWAPCLDDSECETNNCKLRFTLDFMTKEITNRAYELVKQCLPKGQGITVEDYDKLQNENKWKPSTGMICGKNLDCKIGNYCSTETKTCTKETSTSQKGAYIWD